MFIRQVIVFWSEIAGVEFCFELYTGPVDATTKQIELIYY